jgi:hypothetical protein
LINTAFAVASFVISFQADAQEWLFCDNCVTSQDFRNAAVQKVGQSVGEFEYAVGNTVTGKFEYVFVTNFPGDLQPFGTFPEPDGTVDDSADMLGSDILIVQAEDNSVLIDPLESFDPYIESTGLTVGSFPASALENQAFEGAVWAHKNQIIVQPPGGDALGFESFDQKLMENVSLHLYNRMTAANPAWSASQLRSTLRATLFGALKSLFGKGPVACQVFENGDSACFALVFNQPSAAAYIDGTAVDANGIPITSESGGVVGGVEPVNGGLNGAGPNEFTIRFGGGGSELWLVCSFVDGILDSCWIEIVPV